MLVYMIITNDNMKLKTKKSSLVTYFAEVNITKALEKRKMLI